MLLKTVTLEKIKDKWDVIDRINYAKKEGFIVPVHANDIEQDKVSIYVSSNNGKISVITISSVEESETELETIINQLIKKDGNT